MRSLSAQQEKQPWLLSMAEVQEEEEEEVVVVVVAA
jgi:hypothetical protein